MYKYKFKLRKNEKTNQMIFNIEKRRRVNTTWMIEDDDSRTKKVMVVIKFLGKLIKRVDREQKDINPYISIWDIYQCQK